MRKAAAFLIVALLLIAVLMRPSLAQTIAYQTTFNCNEWSQSLGLTKAVINCDSISGYGGWTTSGHPQGDQITLAANYPGGGGGRGFRHWRGDGTNVNGGGIALDFSVAGFNEFWMRFYMRYQTGFNWSPSLNYTKDLYFHDPGVFTLGFHGSNTFGVVVISGSQSFTGPRGWTTVHSGSNQSDGTWHCYETHVKNGSAGIAESWVDGVLAHSNTNVNWNTTASWHAVEIGDNQATVANSGVEMFTDYDDFAFSGTGRVGCFSAAGAPANFRIIR